MKNLIFLSREMYQSSWNYRPYTSFLLTYNSLQTQDVFYITSDNQQTLHLLLLAIWAIY
jgi:hypothetical protein